MSTDVSISDINWLRSNTQNWSIYENKWNKTANARVQDYMKMEFPELTQKWPMLADVRFAPELVSVQIFYVCICIF